MFGHQDDQQPVNDLGMSTPQSVPDNTLDDGHDELGTGPMPTAPQPDDQSSGSMPVAVDDELISIKQQALNQLSPIVSHLEQSPEERFRTTMMMIQASDDRSLIKVAYEAAQNIADEKQKAQALLDIVNEINYFTHQGQES